MTLDTALLFRPTDSLILPSRRKFIPFRIPNNHRQLRHYISTVDPDRIYVAVGRIIYSIHISSRKREIITIVPFDPRCLSAGYGWIAIGGSENGDCAFIKLRSPHGRSPGGSETTAPADVDTPLPPGSEPQVSRRVLTSPPNVFVHEFGGSIVNSATIHRLPTYAPLDADEDVVVLCNNDTTVNVFSLLRMEMLESIRHPVCMNYALISPDSKIMAAVGDENQIYFYRTLCHPESASHFADTEYYIREWSWPLIHKVELDFDNYYEDHCCFTIAFSPSSHLCAVGSQAGLITVFDVNALLRTDEGRNAIICTFKSSRPYAEGGAVRSMTFSTQPWDLLVWVEDHGRVGVADVRQSFSRRQIITLDVDDPELERIKTENLDKVDDGEGSDSESDSLFQRSSDEPSDLLEDSDNFNHPTDPLSRTLRHGEAPGGDPRQNPRETLARDLSDRERQIIDFLNTARWASSIEEGPGGQPRLLSPLPYTASPTTAQPTGHSPFSSSPPDQSSRHEPPARDRNIERVRATAPRRRGSVVLSQDNPPTSTHPSSALIPHPTISLRWARSPPQISSNSPFETTASNNEDPSRGTPSVENGQSSLSSASARHRGGSHRTRMLLDRSLRTAGQAANHRQRAPRSRSIPRPINRPDDDVQRQSPRDLLDPNFRSTLAAERLRLQRQAALAESQRLNDWEQQYRRLLEFDHLRSSSRIRNLPGDLSDRGMHDFREQEAGVGTAGVGWGQDGRTLYIGTVQGILEYHINVQDRKMFPGFTCR